MACGGKAAAMRLSAHAIVNFYVTGISKESEMSRFEQISIFVSFMMLSMEEVRRVNELPLRSEVETWKPY